MRKKGSKFFAMTLRLEDSGIFRQGWLPNELSGVEVICYQQNDVENGALAAIVFNGSKEVLLKRVYKNQNRTVLEAPRNLDKPNELLPPIVLSAGEAAERLTILGKVVKFSFTLKSDIKEVA